MKPFPVGAALRGITLVEACCAIAVAAILAAVVVPDLRDLMARRRLEGTAQQLAADLRLARVLAAASGESIRWTLQGNPRGDCYMIHTGPAGACRCGIGEEAPRCDGAAQPLRTVELPAAERIALHGNVTSIAFEPRLGTAVPAATVRVQGPGGRGLHCIVNLLGRVRICSPDTADAVHRPC